MLCRMPLLLPDAEGWDPLPGEDLSHAKIYHMETGDETELNQCGSFKDEKILSNVQKFYYIPSNLGLVNKYSIVLSIFMVARKNNPCPA